MPIADTEIARDAALINPVDPGAILPVSRSEGAPDTLETVTLRVNTLFEKIARAEHDRDNYRRSLGESLIELRRRIEAGEAGENVTWTQYCRDNVKRSLPDIRKVMRIASAVDPDAEEERQRKAARESMAKTRAERSNVGAQPEPASESAQATPAAAQDSKGAYTVDYQDGSFQDFQNPEIKAVYDAYQKVKPKDRRFCLDHIDAVSMKEFRAEHKKGVRYSAAHEWRAEWLLAHFGVSVTWPELDVWVGGCGDNNYRVTPPASEPTIKCAVKSRNQRIRLALDYIAALDLGLDDLQPAKPEAGDRA